MITATVKRVLQLLPRHLRAKFGRQTVIKKSPKYCLGPQGGILEIKGEYQAKRGKIYLFNIHDKKLEEKQIFYYYAHECGHKYFNEHIGGDELKNLLKLMSTWPLQEDRYRGYKTVRKVEEIFSDVFALFLRMRHYRTEGMKKKTQKIREALEKKAPGGVRFLEKTFKRGTKKSGEKFLNAYPVTHQDFVRLEKVFGSHLL